MRGANLVALILVVLAVAIAGVVAAWRQRRRAEETLRIGHRLAEVLHAHPRNDMYEEVLRGVLDAMGSPRGVFAAVDERGALIAPPAAGGEAVPVTEPVAGAPGRSLSVPIVQGGARIGLLAVEGRAGPYGPRDRARLEGIARAVAPALHARLARERTERERAAAEAALRESERELREAQRVGRIGSWSWDARADRITWSEEYYRIYGLDPSRPPPGYRHHLAAYTPESAARLDAAVQRSMQIGEPYELDLELAGGRGWITARSETCRDAEGRVVGLRGTAQDITERKRAEEALRRSEERYRQIVETTHEGIWMVDARGATTFVNRQMAEMLGRTVEEVRGASFFDFMDEEARRDALGRFERRRHDLAEQHEQRFRRKDGSELWALVDTTPLHDERGGFAGALKMVADISARRRIEEQLLQVQKLDAVGRLAGGVAHDFNNLLTATLGEVQLLVEGLGASDPLRAEALEIEAAARKAAVLTRQLLAFGRKQPMQLHVVDPAQVVGSADRMLRRLIGEDVELITVLDPRLGRVRIDAVQLEQVIVNLAVNARDAMPRGGRLTIECANVDLEDEAARRQRAPPGRWVLLAVHDTGTGMTAEVQAHLFEPFFTTKEPGQGTGLGLSTVYGIVKQAGGEVRVETAPGEGASFEIYLPRAEDAADAAAAEAGGDAAAGPLPRGSETVLVVEDDAMVRSLAVRTLRRAGYGVLEAEDPEHALALFASPDREVSLLVTDVVMPRISGPELAERLRAVRPDLAVLFSSGYSDRVAEIEAQLGPRTAFLPKPFVPRQLALLVRELLDAGQATAEVPERGAARTGPGDRT
jgi:PAS domain S-box-containing protein